MNRHVRINERLLAQYLLLAALAAIATMNEGNDKSAAASRRSRTNKSRCRCRGAPKR
jgi:hypothetical protein